MKNLEKAEGKLQPKLRAEMFSKINSTNRAEYYLKEEEKERERCQLTTGLI